MERLTYDFCIAGKHCWQVKGADNLECSEVCKSRDDEGCNGCKNFRGLQGFRIGALVTCNPQNDMYVFGEEEE